MPSFVTSSSSLYAARTAAAIISTCPSAAAAGDVIVLVIEANTANIDLSPGFTRLGGGPKLLSTGQYGDVQVGQVQAGEPGSGLGYSISCGGDATGTTVAWNGSWAIGYYRGAALPTAGTWGTVTTTTALTAPAVTAGKATAMMVECLVAATSTNTASNLTASTPFTSRVAQSTSGRPCSKVAFGDLQLTAAGSSGTKSQTLTAAQSLGAVALTFSLEPLPQTVAIGRATQTNVARNVLPTVTDYPSLIQNSLPAIWFRMDSDDGYNSGSSPVRGVFNDTNADHSYVAGLTKGSAKALSGRAVSWSPDITRTADAIAWSTAQPIIYEGLLRMGEEFNQQYYWDVANLSEFRLTIQYGLLTINYYDTTGTWTSWTIPGSMASGGTRMVTVTYAGAAVGSTCALNVYIDGALAKSLTAKVNAATVTSFRIGGGNNDAIYSVWDEQQIYLNPTMANWTAAQIATRWTWAKPALVASPQSRSITRVKETQIGQVVRASLMVKINRAIERDLSRTVKAPGASAQALELNAPKTTDIARVIVTPVQNYPDLISRNPPAFWFSFDSTTAFNKGTSAVAGTFTSGAFGQSFPAGLTPGSTAAMNTLRGSYWKVASGVDLTQPFVYEGLFSVAGPIGSSATGPNIMSIPGLITAVFLGTGGILRVTFNDISLGSRLVTISSGNFADSKIHMLTVTYSGGTAGGAATLTFYADGVQIASFATALVPTSLIEVDFGNSSTGSSVGITLDEHTLYTNPSLATDWTASQIAQRWSYANPPPPPQAIALGRATGTSSARPVGAGTGIGRASGGHVARAVAPTPGPVSRALGRASVASSGRAIAAKSTFAALLGRAATTSVARSLGRALSLGRATEAEAGRAVTPQSASAARSFLLGRALEANASRTLAVQAGARSIAIGRASEVDAARTVPVIAGALSRSIGRALEADSARSALTTPGGVARSIGRAGEADSANAVVVHAVIRLPLGRATSVDVAQGVALSSAISIEIGQIAGLTVAEDIVPLITDIDQDIALGRALESSAARVVKVKKAMIGHRAYEDATFSW